VTTPDFFLFVSHVSEDQSAAADIVGELERRGVPCWIAPRDVRPGKPFDDEIAEAIDASRAMLLIFSEHCNESEYIRREVTVAGEAGKIIIPFRIENVQPRKGLRVRLSDLHWIDGFASRERAIDELVKNFEPLKSATASQKFTSQEFRKAPAGMSDNPYEAEQRARQRPAPQAGRSRRVIVGGAALACVLAAMAILWIKIGPPMRAPQPASPPQTSLAPTQPLPAPPPQPSPSSSASTPAPGAAPPTPVAFTPLPRDRERALKPKDTFKECSNCPEMIVVPAGAFTMGSAASDPDHRSDEGPQHTVTFANPFAVGKFTLTFDEWDACVAGGGCNNYMPSDESWGRGRSPVLNVSLEDARGYIAWLSKNTGKTYRLLSEAEQEYVARAGTTTNYSFGDDATALGQYAWYNANSASQTHPVGGKKPNAFGFYDMQGNVWERTADCYHDSYSGAPTDGSAWLSGDCSKRIARGGSWHSDQRLLRSARRAGLGADDRVSGLGLRVARTLTP
jgi:formylglycine-generating enzyme required for sulfatase activity